MYGSVMRWQLMLASSLDYKSLMLLMMMIDRYDNTCTGMQ